ncbi:hypothetical protein [Sporohalobacter salinus]|uniref:hypothetical protein n=1 Tax=Sporohalobacter salinus TaxID=1494606 RepID=UPI0019606926|nr:hypothetical protein [Sporohalobacter salinus]MBM7625136.1 hypothetical protein [Sporohalobacter salinus]
MFSLTNLLPKERINAFVRNNKSKIFYTMFLLILLPQTVFMLNNFENMPKILKNIEMTISSFIVPLIVVYLVLRIGAIVALSKEEFRKKCWFPIIFGVFNLGTQVLWWIISLKIKLPFGVLPPLVFIVVPYYLKEKYGR